MAATLRRVSRLHVPIACATIQRFHGRRVVKKSENDRANQLTPGNYYDYMRASFEFLVGYLLDRAIDLINLSSLDRLSKEIQRTD